MTFSAGTAGPAALASIPRVLYRLALHDRLQELPAVTWLEIVPVGAHAEALRIEEADQGYSSASRPRRQGR